LVFLDINILYFGMERVPDNALLPLYIVSDRLDSQTYVLQASNPVISRRMKGPYGIRLQSYWNKWRLLNKPSNRKSSRWPHNKKYILLKHTTTFATKTSSLFELLQGPVILSDINVEFTSPSMGVLAGARILWDITLHITL
jgi:hypothetical protein